MNYLTIYFRLNLNAIKMEFMLMGSRQRLSTLSDTLELSIDVPIEQVSSLKSLGMYINDENLTCRASPH